MVTAADFAGLVSGSHTARFRAVVTSLFQTGDDPEGTDLELISGSIELNATADIRGTGSVDVVAAWPRAQQLDLAVYGSEVFLARGIETGADSVLWAPLGYYRIEQTSQADAAKGPLKLDLQDRMATIIDSRFLEPRQWLQETEVGDIITEVVTEVYPDAVIQYDDDSNLSQLGRSLIAEESRYAVLETLADGLGKVFYFNGEGILVFETAPDEQTPIWTVGAGSGGVMVNADRSISRDGVYNALVVTGEGPDELPPVRAVAYDAQESSPTFFGGPFGRIPRFYSSPFITTASQAQSAAEKLLRQSLGTSYDVGLSAVPNPALKPYDPIQVVYNDYNRENHVIERVTIPLDVTTAMRAATRQSVVVFVGVQ